MSAFGGASGMWDADGGWRREPDVGAARRTERQLQDDLSLLEERIDKLSVINYALWTLLQEKVGLTESELLERVKVVDLTDGRMDGKVRQQEVAQCTSCGRAMSRRHVRCMYCGEENLTIGAFDSVL